MKHVILRFFALLLAGVLICGVFSGCGKRGEEAETTAAGSTVSETTADPEAGGSEDAQETTVTPEDGAGGEAEHLHFNGDFFPATGCTDADQMLSALKERGGRELQIVCSTEGITSDRSEDAFPICIVGDFRYGSAFVHDSYLAAATPYGIYVYDLSVWFDAVVPFFTDTLEIGDIDGDGVDEILVQQDNGGVGGAGSYDSWVFKVGIQRMEPLFCTNREAQFDTGFESTLLDGYGLQITNRFTGYDQTFDIRASHPMMFDEAGNVKAEEKIFADCFSRFTFADPDGDGICEISCEQYVSLHTHVDYVGTAGSILKFDRERRIFTVADAWFSPREET